jgi:hypothetical protein
MAPMPDVRKNALTVEEISFSKEVVCANLVMAWISLGSCFDDTILPEKAPYRFFAGCY